MSLASAGPVIAGHRQDRVKLSIALVACLGFVVAFTATASQPKLEVVAPAATFGILAVYALSIERRRYGSRGSASPMSVFTVFWFLYLGVMGLGVLGLSTTASFGLSVADVLGGLWIGVLGLLALCVGYEISTRFVRQSVAHEGQCQYTEDCPPWVIGGSLIIGWGATGYLFEKGQVGYLQFGQNGGSGFAHLLVHFSAGLIPLVLAALGAVVWSEREFRSMPKAWARWLLWANIPPLILVALGSGVKGQLLTSLLPLAIVYVLLRGRVPWKGLLFLTVYLVVSFGGIQQYRTNISTGDLASNQTHGVIGPVSSALSSVASDWVTASPTSHFKLFWRNFTTEYSTVPQTIGVIESQTPSPIPFLGTDRYLAAPLFFLPVHDVPGGDLSLGTYVSTNYRGGAGSTSAPPTQPGDFFMSGGLPFVVGGELVVGILSGILWRRLGPSAMRFRATVLYSVIAVGFANGGVDFAGLTRQVLEILVVYGALSWVMFPRRVVQPAPAVEVRSTLSAQVVPPF